MGIQIYVDLDTGAGVAQIKTWSLSTGKNLFIT